MSAQGSIHPPGDLYILFDPSEVFTERNESLHHGTGGLPFPCAASLVEIELKGDAGCPALGTTKSGEGGRRSFHFT